MKQIKSRYHYDPSAPLSKQYDDPEVFNAYYKCLDSQTKSHFLLSHFKTKTQNKTQISSLFKKFTSIQSLTQQGIATKHLNKIYDVFLADSDQSLFLVSDYCQGGSIIDYLGKVYTLQPRAAARVVLGALKGLQQLHKYDIVNCFINLENIEIVQDGTPKISFKCMIYKTYYLSPEFRKDHTKSKQSDIYCLGVCLYRMIFGIFPFKTNKTSELIQMVKNGPSFSVPKQNSIFPLVCPGSIRDLLRGLLSSKPSERMNACEKLSEIYSQSLLSNSQLDNQVYLKIFKSKYINLHTKIDEKDEHEYSILEPRQRKLLKLIIYKAEKGMIDEYLKNVISKFSKLSGQFFIKIYEYQIIREEYLGLVCSYCSEGNLAEYRKKIMGNFSIEQAQETSQFLVNSLQQLSIPYKYLTNQSLCLKNGHLRIMFPSFNTHNFRQMVKQALKMETHFIAPQILAGKNSQNCDSWSIGVLEYWMMYNEMPKTDKNDIFMPDSTKKFPKNKLSYFNSLLQKNPNHRLNLLNDSQVKKLLKSNDESQDTNKQSQLSPDKISKIKKLQKKKESNANAPKQIVTSQLQIKPTSLPLYGLGENINQDISPKRSEKIKISKNNQLTIIDSNHTSNIGILPNKIQFNQQQSLKPKYSVGQSGKPSPKKANNFDMNLLDGVQKANAKEAGYLDQKGKQSKRQSNQSLVKYFSEYVVKVRSKFATLDGGYTKQIRLTVKCLIVIILYLFLFYFNFFKVNGSLIGSRQMYQAKPIPAKSNDADPRPSSNFTLVTKTPEQTYQLFYNKTVMNIRNSGNCVQNDYLIKSNVAAVIKSQGFVTYQVFGILFAVFNLLLMCFVVMRFDLCRACRLTNFDDKKYHPLINYGMIILAIISLTSLHYLIYGGTYHLSLQPCISKTNLPGLEYLMKNLNSSFIVRFVWAYIGIIIAYATIIFFLVKPLIQLNKYFYMGWIALYLMGIGIRWMGKLYPAYENVFGVCGELLSLLTAVFLFFTDLMFSCFFKKEKNTNEQSNIDFKSIQEFNRTEEFFVDIQPEQKPKKLK